jgi:hypothetical protein
MKKVILAAIVTIAISTGLSAQTKNPNGTPGTNKNNSGYVDTNKNGVCDNYENNTRQFAGRGQGQGRRGGYGMGSRQGCMNMQCRRAGNGRTK